jgi:PPOX class probable F420-dependent enzyme
MDSAEVRRRVADASVAVLATVSAEGTPHSVPICFALDGNVVFFAVDQKPKRSTALKRLRNIDANPSVSVLVHHYEHDWRRLWWIRIDGSARVLEAGDEAEHAVALLVDRYMQYRERPPIGPVVAIAIDRMTAWSAEP